MGPDPVSASSLILTAVPPPCPSPLKQCGEPQLEGRFTGNVAAFRFQPLTCQGEFPWFPIRGWSVEGAKGQRRL